MNDEIGSLERGLEGAMKVLKPGGRFLCLEFSKVTLPLAQEIYDAYSFTVIPASNTDRLLQSIY